MDISQSVWNEIDASNNTAAPDGAPEGMATAGVNDVIRADRGAIKRWYNQTIPKLTGGTSTAFTLTYGVAPTALADGMTHLVQFNQACGASPTLNTNGLGALPLHKYTGGAWATLSSGDVTTDMVCQVTYNLAAGAYRVVSSSSAPGATLPTGTVLPYGGTSAPAGFLLCFGQAISRTGFAALFAVCSTTYGAGDGSTTFNLPDLRGRVTAGKDDMGGSNANRLPNSSGTVLGAAPGAEKSNTMDGPSTAFTAAAGADGFPGGQTHTHANVYVVQPTLILNQIIKT